MLKLNCWIKTRFWRRKKRNWNKIHNTILGKSQDRLTEGNKWFVSFSQLLRIQKICVNPVGQEIDESVKKKCFRPFLFFAESNNEEHWKDKKGGTYMMWVLSLVAVLVMIGLDQWTKYLAVTQLKPIDNITVLDGVLDFTFVENRGVAFGMLSGKKWIILLMVAVIVAILVYYFMTLPKKKEYNLVRVALIMVLAGAVGNVIDRIFRGYVVDFFEFTFIQWPVFNVADIYVVCGVILLCVLMLFVIREDKEKKKEE